VSLNGSSHAPFQIINPVQAVSLLGSPLTYRARHLRYPDSMSSHGIGIEHVAATLKPICRVAQVNF
jgi:hypothetical protein